MFKNKPAEKLDNESSSSEENSSDEYEDLDTDFEPSDAEG